MVLMVVLVQLEILAVLVLLETLAQLALKVQPEQGLPDLMVQLVVQVLQVLKVLQEQVRPAQTVPQALKVLPDLMALLVLKDQLAIPDIKVLQAQQALMVQLAQQDQKEILVIPEAQLAL
jgi:hypothetical protein